MKPVLAVLAAAALAWCIVAPLLYFRGAVTVDTYKAQLLIASLAWFLFATLWTTRR